MNRKQQVRLADKCLESDGTRFSKMINLNIDGIITKECIIKNDECKYVRYLFGKYLCNYYGTKY